MDTKSVLFSRKMLRHHCYKILSFYFIAQIPLAVGIIIQTEASGPSAVIPYELEIKTKRSTIKSTFFTNS